MPEKVGDAGEALRLFLVSRSAVTALAGTRISISLDSSEPSVRYSLAGGTASYAEHDPLFLVECWGRGNAPDDGSASSLARTIAAELEGMRGVWGQCWVAGAVVEGGPSDSPDQQTKRPRQLLTVRLRSYPLGGVSGN